MFRKNKPLMIIILYTVLILPLIFISLGMDGFPFKHFSSELLFLGVSLFTLYILYRVPFMGGVKRNILLLCSMMYLWFLFRGAKYFCFTESDLIRRHLWYLYYIPYIYIFIFIFFISLYIGSDSDRKYIGRWASFASVSAVIIGLFLTNDFHQLTFRFNENFADWDSSYSIGIGFYLFFVCLIAVMIASFISYVRKCRLYKARKRGFYLLVPIFRAVIYLLLPKFATGEEIMKLPDTICICVSEFFMLAIAIGIIPANFNFVETFRKLSLRFRLLDYDNREVYKSSAAENRLSKEDMIVSSISVQGGTGLWIQDISDINAINRSLIEVRDALKEENTILEINNRLKEEDRSLDIRNSIYERIRLELRSEIDRIRSITAEIRSGKRERYEGLSRICLIGVFIKRYSNLLIISEDKERLNIQEFTVCINEVLRYFPYRGISGSITCSSELYIDKNMTVSLLRFFKDITTENLNLIKGVDIIITENAAGNIEIRVNIDGKDIPEIGNEPEGLLNFSSFAEGETTFIRMEVEGYSNDSI